MWTVNYIETQRENNWEKYFELSFLDLIQIGWVSQPIFQFIRIHLKTKKKFQNKNLIYDTDNKVWVQFYILISDLLANFNRAALIKKIKCLLQVRNCTSTMIHKAH